VKDEKKSPAGQKSGINKDRGTVKDEPSEAPVAPEAKAPDAGQGVAEEATP
jgi:hypothetical protein